MGQKNMDFTIAFILNLVFIDNKQFMNCSLEKLIKDS